MTLLATIAMAGTLAGQGTAPDLSWIEGYWLSCEDGREVSETWSDPRGGVLAGMTATVRNGRSSFEFAQIAPHGVGLAYFAQPDGQPPAVFPLTEAEGTRVLFADPAHDFPQTVAYARDGDTLTARIAGKNDGEDLAIEWRYRRAAFNDRCPA